MPVPVRLLTFLSLTVALSACSKNLTSQSGARLLEARLLEEGVIYHIVVPPALTNLTTAPRLAPHDATPAVEAFLTRYVRPARKPTSIPDLTGTFTGMLGCGWTAELVFDKGSPRDLQGRYTLQRQNCADGLWTTVKTLSGVFKGEIRPAAPDVFDAVLSFDPPTPGSRMDSYPQATFRLHELADGQLGMDSPDDRMRSVRLYRSPGYGRHTVDAYAYAFSDEFRALLRDGDTFEGGSPKVTSVGDLLLARETMATGTFHWTVPFNEAGRLFVATFSASKETSVSGSGNVLFGKQPDGNWTVVKYAITDNRQLRAGR